MNIIASMIFSGVSGSAVADTSAIGSVLIPAMKKDGYPGPYAAAVTAASSTIGPVIPPSIPLVVYGLLTEESIGRLFLAGAIPGALMGIYLIAASYVISRKRNYPARPRAGLKKVVKSTLDAAAALVMPLIIVVGIVSGIVTPTEAGVLAVAYALVIGLFIYRELNWRELPGHFARSMLSSAYVMAIIASAGIFSYLVAEMRAGDILADFFMSVTQSKWVLLSILNVFFLIWGCILEPMTALVVVRAHAHAADQGRRHRPDPFRRGHRPESDDRTGHSAGGDRPVPGDVDLGGVLSGRGPGDASFSDRTSIGFGFRDVYSGAEPVASDFAHEAVRGLKNS